MTLLNCACIQVCASENIDDNIRLVTSLIKDAAANGAQFILTPENTSFMDMRSGATRKIAVRQKDDKCLKALMQLANELEIWLQIGSLAVLSENVEKLANRSVLISPEGKIVAQYDKIHMFDVDVGDGQSYRESKSFQAGQNLVLAKTEIANIGMSICYDLRFPHMFRELAQAGAELMTLPAAFTKITGQAHWHSLIRARAIENGVFVMAAAQGGTHADGRETFGHSMIVSPWGEVLAEADTEPCFINAEIDLDMVSSVRKSLPSLKHDREFELTVKDVN